MIVANIPVEGMKRQIEALKQKSDQGSMQTQGEAAEIVLEATLAAAFPTDGLVPVAKGVSGADVRQDVTGPSGTAGSILWESKRTKNWTMSRVPRAVPWVRRPRWK